MTTEYVAPVVLADLVKALDRADDEDHRERDEPDEVVALDDDQGYRDGIITALLAHFGYAEGDFAPVCNNCLDGRLEEAFYKTGIYERGAIEHGPYAGQPITVMNLHKQVMQDPEVKQANEEVARVVAQLRAARHAFNEAWGRLLMSEHKAAWLKGVGDADKYVPLLADLFQPEQDAAD